MLDDSGDAISRRSFIRTAALAAAAPFAVPVLPLRGGVWPSDTLVVGLIGCRGMGYGNLVNHLKQPGVVCGGLCDVDRQVLANRAAEVENLTNTRPELFTDFRTMIERSDVDAVIIATPDHWHCLQTALAAEAGKHVYIEKPLANSIDECEAMVRAVRRYGIVAQVGQQQRSGRHWQDVVEFVRSGKLGDVRLVKIWGHFEYGKGAPRVADEPPPSHLDFDMWLGPAPMQPYNPSRVHSVWRHQWDFGGGLLTDWGVHLLDIALWAMDVDYPPPSVSSVGGIYTYSDRAIETPDTLSTLYEMDGFTLTWDHAAGLSRGPYGRNYGIAFVGNNGTLVVNRAGWEVIVEEAEEKPLMEAVPFQEGVSSNHERHAVDFIAAIREGREPASPIEVGRDAAVIAHMGNIALRTGSRLVWDPGAGRFRGNPQADGLLRPDYREPWSFPAV